jgi:hypothetical protein
VPWGVILGRAFTHKFPCLSHRNLIVNKSHDERVRTDLANTGRHTKFIVRGGHSLNRVCWILAQTSICLVHQAEVSTI